MKALISYLSYSGNTEEIAELIRVGLETYGYETEMRFIEGDKTIDYVDYDLLFIGTFTWGQGSVPDEIVPFIRRIKGNPTNLYVFGSGDTQFGGDTLFCRAVDLIRNYVGCEYPGLKIEQSPRGSQEALVKEWLEGVIKDAKSKNIRA